MLSRKKLFTPKSSGLQSRRALAKLPRDCLMFTHMFSVYRGTRKLSGINFEERAVQIFNSLAAKVCTSFEGNKKKQEELVSPVPRRFLVPQRRLEFP